MNALFPCLDEVLSASPGSDRLPVRVFAAGSPGNRRLGKDSAPESVIAAVNLEDGRDIAVEYREQPFLSADQELEIGAAKAGEPIGSVADPEWDIAHRLSSVWIEFLKAIEDPRYPSSIDPLTFAAPIACSHAILNAYAERVTINCVRKPDLAFSSAERWLPG